MLYNPPVLIAEIGCNHMGDIDIAKRMIKRLAISEIPCVKFQKRCPKECLTPEQYNAPHPNPAMSYGKTYGEHREFLEFDVDQHQDLKRECDYYGIQYSTSVWDMTSAKEIVEKVKPESLKIPSACNENKELIEYICEEFEGEIHISTGMTRTDDVMKIISFFGNMNRKEDLVLYHCVSGYPVEMENNYLMEIKKLHGLFSGHLKAIGFSGHHRGIAVDIAAYTLGAAYIERHHTEDRTNKGTDHCVSLEIGGISKLWRDLNATYKSLKYKEGDFAPCEIANMKKLKTIRTL